jgi:folate-binding protein YgfZ
MLLTMVRDVKDTVVAKFEQFIFSEDVKLGDVTDTFAQIAIVGPEASHVLGGVLSGIGVEALNQLADHGSARATFGAAPVIVVHVSDTGEPGFDLFVERAQADSFLAALAARGVPMLDAATADALRIEAGVPVFHRDMDEETIPLEAGIESRAISFTKGCYVGQEVIIRVLHRGHGRVARKLVGLVLDAADAPAAGAVITIDGREAGHVTSSTQSPLLGKPIALAYLQRDHTEPGTTVSLGSASAVVAALPFRPRPALP